MNKFALFTLVLLAAVRAHGQVPAASGSPTDNTPPPLPPPGPLIASDPGDFASWVVTETRIQSKGSSAPKPTGDDGAKAGPLSQRIFIKTGNVIRVQTMKNGAVGEDRWIVNGVQVILAPSAKYPVVDHNAYQMRGESFSGFSWISAKNFRGVQAYSGHKCLMFKDTKDISGGGPALIVPIVALVDFDTRFPVALQTGTVLASYQFKDPPTVVQTLPDEVSSTIAQLQPSQTKPPAHP